ncbi:MAG: hypothetical protein P8L74_00310 [Gammaproteobacteria bacterium]|nr:hypothetical protein [Gammaproteobacteria bacterium]
MEIFIPIIFVIIAGWLYAINDGDKFLDGSIRGGIKTFNHLTKKQGSHKEVNKYSNEIAIVNYKDGVKNGATTYPHNPTKFGYFKMGELDGYNAYEGSSQYKEEVAFYFAGTTFWKARKYHEDGKIFNVNSLRLNGVLEKDITSYGYRDDPMLYGMTESSFSIHPADFDKKVNLYIKKEKGVDKITLSFSTDNCLLGEDISIDDLADALRGSELVNSGLEGEKIYYWDNDHGINKEPKLIMARENYKNGMKEGIQEYFYESGILEYRLNYEAGVPSGIWKWYSEDGQHTQERDCSDMIMSGFEELEICF